MLVCCCLLNTLFCFAFIIQVCDHGADYLKKIISPTHNYPQRYTNLYSAMYTCTHIFVLFIVFNTMDLRLNNVIFIDISGFKFIDTCISKRIFNDKNKYD